MRGRWTWLTGLAAAAAALILLATGCGSSSSNVSATSAVSGATIAPASAPVFLAVDTDQASSQWKTADGLLSKFPIKDKLLASLNKSLSSGAGVDFAHDVLPYVGPELDVVVLGFGGSSQNVVGIAKPTDTSKFDAALAQGKTPSVHETIGGFTVFSDKQSALDTFKSEAAKGKLADDATFKTAMAKLSDAALVKAYVNGAQVTTALQQASPQLGQLLGGSNGKFVSASAELVAASDGVKLDATLTREGGVKPTPVSSSLVGEIPAPALGALVFNGKGISSQLEGALGAAGGVSGLQALAPMLKQLLSVLGGDNALYVRSGGALLPEVTLVTTPSSPDQGMAAIDRLVTQLGSGVTPKPVTIGSVHAKELNLGRVSIFYGVQGAHLIVTDQQQAFQDLQGGGGKLTDDATFKEAKSAAGMPDQTDGFLYLNLKDAIPLVESLAQLAGSSIPASVSQNLQPLRTFTAWSTTSGGDTSFTAFLEVR